MAAICWLVYGGEDLPTYLYASSSLVYYTHVTVDSDKIPHNDG